MTVLTILLVALIAGASALIAHKMVRRHHKRMERMRRELEYYVSTRTFLDRKYDAEFLRDAGIDPPTEG